MGCAGSSFVLSRHYPEIIFVQENNSHTIEKAFENPRKKPSVIHEADHSRCGSASRNAGETTTVHRQYSVSSCCVTEQLVLHLDHQLSKWTE